MVDVPQVQRDRPRRGWTVVAAVFAFLVVAFALVILGATWYSSAFDSPASPGGVAIATVLILVPFVVGTLSYQRGRRRGMPTDPLVRRVALTLIGVGIGLYTALVLLAGPI